MRTIAPQIRRAAPAPAHAVEAPTRLEVQIEAVVLHGFARGDGHRAVVAFERELTRLVSTRGLPEVASTEHMDAGVIPAAARPEMTGIRAARAVHEGLGA